MVAPQRKRFVCPLCETSVLSPSRMAKDDVRRFCLGCSKRTGKLVVLVSPVLERQRQRSKERVAKKAATKRRQGAPQRRELAQWRQQTRRDQKEREEADAERRVLIEERVASTKHGSKALRRLGYAATRYTDELLRAGVTLLQSSVNTSTLWAPGWTNWLLEAGIVTETRDSAFKIIRYLAHDEESRKALQAAMATGERRMTLRLALDLYPFPVAKALRDAIRGDDA